MHRNRIFSIKGVTVDTVEIKHNYYGKIIRDKMMNKIKEMLFKYHEGGKEMGKSEFSSFVLVLFFHPCWITCMTS